MNEPIMPKGYTCPHCAKFNEFTSWVYAHWSEVLFHKCDCGTTNNVLRGRVLPPDEPEVAKKPKKGRSKQ